MNEKIKIELGDVEKTLFMPVWARAVESKKEKPLLVDNMALQIMGSVDFDFDTMWANIPAISQLSWIARCKRFDWIVNQFLRANSHAAVVNVGCGLDTMYERVARPDVTWYDVDLPGVINLHQQFFPESEHRKCIGASLLDHSWFSQVNERPVLFVLKGVLVYFHEEEVRNFLIKIADYFPGAQLFFDVTSPKGVEVANMVIRQSGLGAESYFKWGLKDKRVFSCWNKRIKLFDTYHTFRMKGVHVGFKDWGTSIISDALDIQYMVHLKIEEQT